MSARRIVWLACGLLLAAGCAVGPDHRRPDPGRLPPRFAAATDSAGADTTLLRSAWWRRYGAADLDSLVAEALAGNWDLAQAAGRILAARGQLTAAGAPRLPNLEVGGSATRSKMTLSRFGFSGSVYNNLYDVHLGASWELDLWGRLTRNQQAARAQWLASEADRQALRQSLIGSVVRGWLEVGEADAQAEVARRIAAVDSALLDLARRRYERGVVPVERLLEARQAAAASRVAASQRTSAARERRRALALLLGRYPAADSLRGPDLLALPDLPPVPPGMPAEVVARRPDVVAAELRLRAATARIGAVEAELFPRITLTGQDGSTSSVLDQLLTDAASVWSLAASVAMPLLNRGAVTGRKRAAVGEAAQARAAYVQAVLAALRDVESALDADRETHRQLADLRAAEADAAARRDLSERRYRQGIDDATALLQARRQYYSLLSQRLAAERAARAARVGLLLALGGEWDTTAGEVSVPADHPFAETAVSLQEETR